MKRTISFADEAAFNKMMLSPNNATGVILKNSPLRNDSIISSIKKVPTAIQKQFILKEQQVKQKYRNLRKEAEKLHQDFEAHQKALEKIKVNKFDNLTLQF